MTMEPIDITPLLKKRLSPGCFKLLRSIGDFADTRGWKVYSVGGSVRDLLLNKSNFDLDILVEEHGLEFAREFARREKGAFKLYRRFATAMVILPGGRKIDITTTRGEFYPEPGSLPQVIPGTLEEDIRRRDFTINALAFSLNRENFGRLIDLTGGFEDLQQKIIRVLHADSFRDDPTRIFRAVRFQQRLGFKIEPETEEMMRTAVDLRLFNKVSPERLRRELELIFNEPDPPGAIDSMARYDELRFIHPRLSYSEDLKHRLVGLKRGNSWLKERFPGEEISLFRLYFGALIFSLPASSLQEAGDKFNLSRKFSGQLKVLKKREDKIMGVLSSGTDLLPGQVFSLLRGLDSEVILIVMAWSGLERAISRIKRYLEEYRFVSTEVSGMDLKKMGIPPGPEYKRILDEVLLARLNGRVRSKEEELKLVSSLVDTLKGC